MDQTTPPFGDDLFPALQKLLGFLEPCVKLVFLAAIVLSLPYAPPDPRISIPPQAVVPLQLLAVAYLSGWWKLPNVPGNFVNLATGSAELLRAFYIVSSRVGVYFIVGLLASLGCYMPVYHDLQLPFQPWLPGLIVFVVAAVGFFAPTAGLVGPARFGYLHHAAHLSRIYRLLLDWWVYAALFLILSPAVMPSAGLGLVAMSVAMSVAALIHVCREYAAQRAAVTEAVAQHAATASLAAAAAREDEAVAARYEALVAAAATAARRDGLQARLARPSDFYDNAAKAWAALGTLTQPAEDAAERAQALYNAAEGAAKKAKSLDDTAKVAAPGAGKPDDKVGQTEKLGRDLAEAAQATLDKARLVVEKFRVAQEAMEQCKKATDEDEKWRAAAKRNDEAAVEAVKSVAEVVKKWAAVVASAAVAAAETREKAGRAVAAATDGEMKKAWELADSAKTLADGAKESVERLRAETGHGQQALISWLDSKCETPAVPEPASVD